MTQVYKRTCAECEAERVYVAGEIGDVTNGKPAHVVKDLPSVSQVRKIMRSLAITLYEAWKAEISDRLLHLEFEGFITKDNIQIPSAVWRLPNPEVRYALCKLEDDLERLGYDYDFKFDDVDDVNWTMFYSIALPDGYDVEEDEQNGQSDEQNEEQDERERNDNKTSHREEQEWLYRGVQTPLPPSDEGTSDVEDDNDVNFAY
jgi:hypothetical protein